MTPHKSSYVLGADIGTSSCKALLVNDQGQVVASGSDEYPCLYPEPGFVEQEPEAWYRAFCRSTQRVITKSRVDAGAIRAVCIVGVTHNPVLLDSKDRVIRNSIHFWDLRSTQQVRQIIAKWGDVVRKKALNEPDELWTWPQLLWIREHEPQMWDQIACLLFPKDYVRHRLSPTLLTDSVDPTGTLLYDPRRSEWIREFVDDLDFPFSALPKIQSPHSIAGVVSSKAADDSGLAPGTPILTGTTDTAAELLGSGAVRTGVGVIKLASVGRIMLVMEEPIDHPTVLNYPHVIEGLWYPGSVTKYGAGAYSWARKSFWSDAVEEGVYQKMDASAAGIAAGCGGILFHPHLSGEYAPQWDARLRASFTGLTLGSTRGHFTRAVLEGVAFQIRSALAQTLQHGGSCQEIRLIGGGANSNLWAQIMADVLGMELGVPEQRSAAFGACIMAGKATGLFPIDFDELVSIERFSPDPDHKKIYEDLYGRYRRMESSLGPISYKIDELIPR